MTTQTQSFLQGEVVDGKYHLRQYLGGSDHGAVFLTEYGSLRPQKAAIKLVRVRPGNAELQLSRWRLAANLSHPHLVRIFDLGRCEVENSAMLYVVMELADENLAQIIPERPLTPDETREMLAPVLDALSYMHSRGFVHGRIKPSNIMAVGEELKLSSDGICRLADAIDSQSAPGVYDPPEGARNGAAPAGDVWSLGVTLIEVLTQQPLGWNPAERKEPSLPEALPEAFEDIARHCLRREPKSRWTAPDLADHLPRTPIATPVRTAAIATPAVQPVKAAPAKSAPVHAAPAQAGPVEAVAAPKQKTDDKTEEKTPVAHRYVIGAIAFGVTLFAIIAGPRFFRQQPAAPKTSVAEAEKLRAEPPHIVVTQPGAQPQPVRQPKAVAETKPALPNQAAPVPVSEPVAKETPSPAPSPASAPPPARPAEPMAQPPSSDLIRGGVLQQVLPEVPRQASDTISGTVRVNVKVNVDPSGNVTAAELDAPGPSRYFANLSLHAARDWKFTPPKMKGENVASAWLLHFGYTSAGPKVAPSQTSP
jgi:TonB family protein